MFLISCLLLTSITGFVQSDVQNEVHEWGIVVFEENSPLMCGESWQDINLYPEYIRAEACAEAPVVWIYGEPFETGTFTVTTGEQSIFLTYPVPDRTALGLAEWDISAYASTDIVVENIEETPMILEGEETVDTFDGPFWWAMDSWREVQSLSLYQEYTGITENFLYYECELRSGFTDNFFEWGSNGNPVFTGTEIQEALYFTPGGIFSVSVPTAEFTPLTVPMLGGISTNTILDAFSAWGRSNLEPAEISALWETWEPVFTEEDSFWLVFPIPEQYYNSISTISLEMPESRLIVYNRLFLGAVKLNR
ncbi:MAG: hypothetical protein KAS73_02790 [Candidatus Sabulitectum sp.]|nr:hypothetical protein [Candidatus Sabulitectum sp.]